MYQLGYDSLIFWNSQADEYHKPKVECTGAGNKRSGTSRFNRR